LIIYTNKTKNNTSNNDLQLFIIRAMLMIVDRVFQQLIQYIINLSINVVRLYIWQ